MSPQDQRWLLPRHQTEYPTRDLISESTLHARRESTFLVLASLVLVATTAIVLSGTLRVIDVSALLASRFPDLQLDVAVALPLGMLPCALAFVAVLVVSQLYGRRRAGMLAWASLFAAGVAVGLARLTDLADGGEAAFGASLALAAYVVVGQLANLVVFNAQQGRTRGRRFWLRASVATLAAQIVGAAALMGALYGYASIDGAPDMASLTALALGCAAYGVMSTLVVLVPTAAAVHALALYLRVARFVDDDDDDYLEGPQGGVSSSMVMETREAHETHEAREARDEPPRDEPPRDEPPRPPPPPRARRASLQPFTSSEMHFFSEGDQLD